MHELESQNPITMRACAVAREKLETGVYDVLHDLPHHKNVLSDAFYIVKKESLKDKLDLDVLKISVMWHDVERHKQDFTLLKRTLFSLGADCRFVGRVVDAISLHSFDQTPISLEGQVMWDADKCQYPLIERISLFLKGVKEGNISYSDTQYYQREWKRRVPMVEDMLHFETAKEIFRKRLSNAKELIESIPELSDWKYW